MGTITTTIQCKWQCMIILCLCNSRTQPAQCVYRQWQPGVQVEYLHLLMKNTTTTSCRGQEPFGHKYIAVRCIQLNAYVYISYTQFNCLCPLKDLLVASLGSLGTFWAGKGVWRYAFTMEYILWINIETKSYVYLYRLVTFNVNITDLHKLNNLKMYVFYSVTYHAMFEGTSWTVTWRDLTHRLCVLLLECLTQKVLYLLYTLPPPSPAPQSFPCSCATCIWLLTCICLCPCKMVITGSLQLLCWRCFPSKFDLHSWC